MLTGLLESKCGAKLWCAKAGALMRAPVTTANAMCPRMQASVTGKYMRARRLRAQGSSRAGSKTALRKDLSGVHQSLRIQRGLQRPHHRHRVLAVFVEQVLLLAETDAVLAGAGAAEPERPLHQPRVQRLHLRHLRRIGGIENEVQVEVAVAGVADERRIGARGRQVALGLDDALG